jgi:hypothetical protein
MLTTYVIHPELLKCGVAEWIAYLIDGLIGVGVLMILIFFVMPLLNEALGDETSMDSGDLDPGAETNGRGGINKNNNSAMVVFSATMAGVGYLAKRNNIFKVFKKSKIT